MTATVKKPTNPLTHLIPDTRFADEYVSRQVNGIEDYALLEYAMQSTADYLTKEREGLISNVMLFGPTGPGKTSLVLAYAARYQRPLVTIQCHGAVDPATFWGGLVLNPDTGLYEWQDSDVTKVIKHGGVLYLDEVNFLPSKVAANIHNLLDKRRQITILEKGNEVVDAHPELLIVVAYNPDYEGTRPLNAAFKNRFAVKVKFDYDPAVEAELLGIPVMQELAAKLRDRHKAGDLDTPISTNMLVEFEILAIDLGYGFAVSNFLNAFGEDERGAVTEVFDLYAERIGDQVKQMLENGVATDDASV